MQNSALAIIGTSLSIKSIARSSSGAINGYTSTSIQTEELKVPDAEAIDLSNELAGLVGTRPIHRPH